MEIQRSTLNWLGTGLLQLESIESRSKQLSQPIIRREQWQLINLHKNRDQYIVAYLDTMHAFATVTSSRINASFRYDLLKLVLAWLFQLPRQGAVSFVDMTGVTGLDGDD